MRESGILMHISSLPNAYGIGTMGKCAYDFVDFLQAAGQHCWQILPLSPTGYGDSPYQSFSTFAGNHYLIDLDTLVQEGLLTKEELAQYQWNVTEDRVDYGLLYENRSRVLHLACGRFADTPEFLEFVRENRQWLEDYSLFMALKEKFDGAGWQSWPTELLMRDGTALENCRRELAEKIRYQYFLQFKFFEQWKRLRAYANEKGIRIIGDVPIYVPMDSADVWAAPGMFQLDASRRPGMVAGCPPDSFSADGQLWGNPLYNWDEMKRTGYVWWIRRLRAASRMYDVVRFDHFRGFESYWAIPAGDKTAAGGQWLPGPGMDFINAVKQALPELDFIAEDLGFVTPEVRALQEDSGYPGMKVMEFAFDSREVGDYLPHGYPVNSVVYSGTHDNMTLRQWFGEADPADVAEAEAYLGLSEKEGFVWGMIRGCMASVSRLCVIQMQDYLDLGGEARMNTPGLLSGKNWTWRAKAGSITPELAEKIRTMTRRFGRM